MILQFEFQLKLSKYEAPNFGNISTRDFNSNHNPILEDSVKYFHLFNGILTLISLH